MKALILALLSLGSIQAAACSSDFDCSGGARCAKPTTMGSYMNGGGGVCVTQYQDPYANTQPQGRSECSTNIDCPESSLCMVDYRTHLRVCK